MSLLIFFDKLKIVFGVFVVLSLAVNGQTALINEGAFQIHEDGQIGFHTNFINNQAFDKNKGLAGFYGNDSLIISGSNSPSFYNFEIARNTSLSLYTSINVLNSLFFNNEDLITPKNNPKIFVNFPKDASYLDASNSSKINGYASCTNRQNFIFPIGDSSYMRPLSISSERINDVVRCAYYYENPNSLSAHYSLSTEKKNKTVKAISTQEFWHLKGSVPSTITLGWNIRSAIHEFVKKSNEIAVVGWSKRLKTWSSLGNKNIKGDLRSGEVTSELFIPDDYEIITLGSLEVSEKISSAGNYILTPNNDGVNDVLVFEEFGDRRNNSIQIFDRNGITVFKMNNYTNEFKGISNSDNFVIDRKKGLPRGVYFYLLTLNDMGLIYQGFVVIER